MKNEEARKIWNQLVEAIRIEKSLRRIEYDYPIQRMVQLRLDLNYNKNLASISFYPLWINQVTGVASHVTDEIHNKYIGDLHIKNFLEAFYENGE